MVKITLNLDVEQHVIDIFDDYVDQVNESIDDYNEENGTNYNHIDRDKVLGDMFNDVFPNSVDCIVYWQPMEDKYNPNDQGYVNVDY